MKLKEFKATPDDDDQLFTKFDEESFDPEGEINIFGSFLCFNLYICIHLDFLTEIPHIGPGIDFTNLEPKKAFAKPSDFKKNSGCTGSVVDLGKVLLNTSYLEDSFLDSSNQSFLDESLASLSFQNENNLTISEILNHNENEVFIYEEFFFKVIT